MYLVVAKIIEGMIFMLFKISTFLKKYFYILLNAERQSCIKVSGGRGQARIRWAMPGLQDLLHS